ncbi:hypothetical protein [Methanothrix sp.]|uniref:hypothetical protein n=1 Tax=Methanothrix sp. TaxID=90426 RepID=UPI001BD392F7
MAASVTLWYGSDIKKRPYTGWNSGEKGGENGPCSQTREQYPALLSCASVDKSWTSPQRGQSAGKILGSAMPCDLAVSQKIFSALQYHFTLQ